MFNHVLQRNLWDSCKMFVNLTRVDRENNMPTGLVSMLDTELDSSADVVLLLADNSVVKAHKCFLSASPVLKEVLMSLDCRLDKVVHISMADFDKMTVLSFIQFLYKGFVGRMIIQYSELIKYNMLIRSGQQS